MANFNSTMLIGRLTRDPEKRATPSGATVVQFGMAVNERFTRKDGQKGERTLFVDVVAWGKLGDNCAEYLRKGREIFLTGRLSRDDWEDKNGGGKRHKYYVTATVVQFLSAGGNGHAAAPEQTEAPSDAPVEEESPSDEAVPF